MEDDDDDFGSDSHRCKEEWFDLSLSLGKTFNLPNLSCPLLHHSSVHHDNCTIKPEILVQNGSNLNSVNANPPPIATDQVCVNNISSLPNDCSSGLMGTQNQPRFSDSGVNNDPLSCPSQNPRSNLSSFINGTSSEPNSEKIDLAISVGPNSSSSSSSSSFYSSSCLMTFTKEEPETLVPEDDQDPIKPKQESEDINGQDQEKDQISGSSETESGDHKCFLCNLAFPSGNALGGHMSSHARKRKIAALMHGGVSIFRSNFDLPFQEEEAEDTGGNLKSESSVIVGEKIDNGSGPSSSNVDEEVDDDQEEEHESSSPAKVARRS